MVVQDSQERVLGLSDSPPGLEETALGGSPSTQTHSPPTLGSPRVFLRPCPYQLVRPVPRSPADWRSHVQSIVDTCPTPVLPVLEEARPASPLDVHPPT